LLVRSAKGKLCLRRIDRVAVIGQQVWFSFLLCYSRLPWIRLCLESLVLFSSCSFIVIGNSCCIFGTPKSYFYLPPCNDLPNIAPHPRLLSLDQDVNLFFF
jgi:hypothetical protein